MLSVLFPHFDHAAIEERFASWQARTRFRHSGAEVVAYAPDDRACDVAAEVEWTDWVRLDGVAPLLAWGTDQTYDELSGSLAHLQELGLMRFGRDGAGAIYYQVRMDQAARMAALLDDQARARRN